MPQKPIMLPGHVASPAVAKNDEDEDSDGPLEVQVGEQRARALLTAICARALFLI